MSYYGIPVADSDSAVSTLKPYSYLGSVNVSASTTLDETYLGKIITITAPNVVVTLPYAGTTPGFVQLVVRYTGTTGSASVVTQGSDTISTGVTSATTILFNPGDTVELVSNTIATWLNVSSSSASGGISTDLSNNTDPTKGAALVGYYNGSNVKSALDTLTTTTSTNTTSINTLNGEVTSAINGINTLTNARTKYNIVATAAGQRTYTVPNGYVIGRVEVFMYNTYLVEGTDYTATDGLTIYLINNKIYSNVNVGDAMTVSALLVYTTVVNPVDSTSLASSGGATLVGYGTQTVKQALDQLNLVRTKYSIAATAAAQITFTIPNGYIVGRLELFMYNAYLVEGVDYTATDGLVVHLINTKLYSAVKVGDLLIASTLLVYSEGQNPADKTSLASSGGASLIGYGTQTVAQALNNTILNRHALYFTNQSTNTITISSGYQPGFIDVYLNGVRIPPASGLYNASNGTTVVFAHNLQTTDVVECLVNTAFSFYNGVQASDLSSSQAGLGAQMVGYSVGGTVAAALNALLGSPTFVQGTVTSANQVVLPVAGGYTPGTVRGVITGLGLSLQRSDFTATDGLNITLTNSAITLPIGTTYTVEFYQPYVALQTQINTAVNTATSSAAAAASASTLALTVVPQVQVLDYPSLRTYSATGVNNVLVTGASGTVAPSQIYGTFVVDPSDTTSADNGGTIIVGVGGKRWKRQFSGPASAEWFLSLVTGSGATEDWTAAIQSLLTSHLSVFFPNRTLGYRITAPVNLRSGQRVSGSGAKIFRDDQNNHLFSIVSQSDIIIQNLGFSHSYNMAGNRGTYSAIYALTSSNVKVTNCDFNNIGLFAVSTDVSGDDWVITENRFYNIAGTAYDARGGHNHIVSNNIIVNTGDDAIDVSNTPGAGSKRTIVSNNTIENPGQIQVGGGGIRVSSFATVVANNNIYNANMYFVVVAALTTDGTIRPDRTVIHGNVGYGIKPTTNNTTACVMIKNSLAVEIYNNDFDPRGDLDIAIQNVVDNGSGQCRFTATAHGYTTGNLVRVENVVGVTNANGQGAVTVIDANTFDITTLTFSGTYTSGGTAYCSIGAIRCYSGDNTPTQTDLVVVKNNKFSNVESILRVQLLGVNKFHFMDNYVYKYQTVTYFTDVSAMAELFIQRNIFRNGKQALFQGWGAGIVSITRLSITDNDCTTLSTADTPLSFDLATITSAEVLRNRLYGAVTQFSGANNVAEFFFDGDFSNRRYNQGTGTIPAGATVSAAISHGSARLDGTALQPKTREISVDLALGATAAALVQPTQIFSSTFIVATNTAAPTGGIAFVWRLAPVVQRYVNGTLSS